MKNKAFGWQKDLPDHRDFLTSVSLVQRAQAPSVYDMRSQCPPVYDQGQLGSCTAQAVCGVIQFTEKEMLGTVRPVPSRLFTYYNSRAMQGTVQSDSGSSLRTAIKSVASYGYVGEAKWPYMVTKFKNKPTNGVYIEASKHKLTLGDIQYARVTQRLDDMKAVLFQNNPIVFGFSVYESFGKAAANGAVPMPSKNEAMVGGHAVVLVGYDDAKQWFIVRNSWGTKWGDKGYCYFPYEYALSSLADDFWTIKAVPAP